MAEDLPLLSRIEDASLNASGALQQRWLDGWILRYCPGKARRSRCINAVAVGRLPVQQKLALAADLYRETDLPMVFRITRFTEPADLDAQLQALGWHRLGLTHVQVRSALQDIQPQALPAGTHWVQLAPDDYAEVVGDLRGSPVAHRLSHAERLAGSPTPYQGYAIVRDADGLVLACGQSAQEADLVGLFDVQTRDSERGLGLASRLCERLLAQAAAAGARVAYLQVEAGNAAALKMYDRLGFASGYNYHYRETSASQAAIYSSAT